VSARGVGRSIGLLLLAQGAATYVAHFVLLAHVSVAPGFLANAASHALQVRIAVLLWFAAGAATLCIAIVAMPILRARSERMAMLFLALAVIGLCTLAVDNVGILTMLSVSQDFAKAGSANGQFEPLWSTIVAVRLAAHFTNILFGGIGMFVLDVMLFRFALVPRALAGAAAATVPFQTAAVMLWLLGYPFRFGLVTPTGVMQLLLVAWLIAKGFEERRDALVRATVPELA
jgi:multidrug transporter EmrE-like cation transporter